MPEGWFLFSTYISPENTNMTDVISHILDNTTIVKSWNGDVYWPLMNINSIGNMVAGEGYQIKMTSLDTLSLEGDLVPSDYPIDIPGGWFLMAYLHQNPADAEAMMSPLVEDLVII